MFVEAARVAYQDLLLPNSYGFKLCGRLVVVDSPTQCPFYVKCDYVKKKKWKICIGLLVGWDEAVVVTARRSSAVRERTKGETVRRRVWRCVSECASFALFSSTFERAFPKLSSRRNLPRKKGLLCNEKFIPQNMLQ